MPDPKKEIATTGRVVTKLGGTAVRKGSARARKSMRGSRERAAHLRDKTRAKRDSVRYWVKTHKPTRRVARTPTEGAFEKEWSDYVQRNLEDSAARLAAEEIERSEDSQREGGGASGPDGSPVRTSSSRWKKLAQSQLSRQMTAQMLHGLAIGEGSEGVTLMSLEGDGASAGAPKSDEAVASAVVLRMMMQAAKKTKRLEQQQAMQPTSDASPAKAAELAAAEAALATAEAEARSAEDTARALQAEAERAEAELAAAEGGGEDTAAGIAPRPVQLGRRPSCIARRVASRVKRAQASNSATKSSSSRDMLPQVEGGGAAPASSATSDYDETHLAI